jgi:hypothetical protein
MDCQTRISSVLYFLPTSALEQTTNSDLRQLMLGEYEGYQGRTNGPWTCSRQPHNATYNLVTFLMKVRAVKQSLKTLYSQEGGRNLPNIHLTPSQTRLSRPRQGRQRRREPETGRIPESRHRCLGRWREQRWQKPKLRQHLGTC